VQLSAALAPPKPNDLAIPLGGAAAQGISNPAGSLVLWHPHRLAPRIYVKRTVVYPETPYQTYDFAMKDAFTAQYASGWRR
jgi:hypothetical protein